MATRRSWTNTGREGEIRCSKEVNIYTTHAQDNDDAHNILFRDA